MAATDNIYFYPKEIKRGTVTINSAFKAAGYATEWLMKLGNIVFLHIFLLLPQGIPAIWQSANIGLIPNEFCPDHDIVTELVANSLFIGRVAIVQSGEIVLQSLSTSSATNNYFIIDTSYPTSK